MEQENSDNLNEIRKKLSSFNKDAAKLKDFYLTPSYMGLLNVGRKELQHSRFLAWLFNKNYFDQNSFISPLFLLLDLIMKRSATQKTKEGFKVDENLLNKIALRSFNIIDSSVLLEDHFTDADKNPRSADIIVKLCCRQKSEAEPFNIFICIENKVLSKEHDDQTVAYYNHYIKHDSQYKIFLYLTPLSSLKLDDYDNLKDDEKCNCDKFLQINYQDIVSNILEPLKKTEREDSQKYFIIDDYIKTLRYPLWEEKENKKTIMAMDKKERDLLVQFWDNNHELIELALKALAEEDSELSDVINSVNKSVDELQAKTEDKKDNRKFVINGENGEYGKINIAKIFAQKFFEKHNNLELEKLNEEFRKTINKDGNTEYFTKNNEGKYLVLVGEEKGIYFKAGIWGQSGPNWKCLEAFLTGQNDYFTIEESKKEDRG